VKFHSVWLEKTGEMNSVSFFFLQKVHADETPQQKKEEHHQVLIIGGGTGEFVNIHYSLLKFERGNNCRRTIAKETESSL
jgi:hypothetical protein